MSLATQLEAARNEVARLEQIAATATCAEIGHRWESIGGANCGCEKGDCSVPVNTCKVCGNSDYGDNDAARDVRRLCRQTFVAYGPMDDT